MSGGSTIVFEFTSAATPNMGIDAVSGIDYATEVRISAYYDSTPSFFYDNVSQINLMGNQCDDGLNRVAMTFAASKLSLSVNGAAAETTPLGEGVFAMITQIPLIAHYDFLHSITVYPSQADGALPALSTLP